MAVGQKPLFSRHPGAMPQATVTRGLRPNDRTAQLQNLRFGLVEEVEERVFLRMVGLGGVAGGRADAAVLLVDQIVVTELLFNTIAPIVAGYLVKTLGEGFRQPVGQGLGHNRMVVVVVSFEAGGQFARADAGGHCESAQIVRSAGIEGGNIVGEGAEVVLPLSLPLLAKGVKAGEFDTAVGIAVDEDVVSNGSRRPESVDGIGRKEFLVDDPFQKPLRVIKEFLRFRANLRVVEDLGILAAKFPSGKEGGPIDERDEFLQGELCYNPSAGEGRCVDLDGCPVCGKPPG